MKSKRNLIGPRADQVSLLAPTRGFEPPTCRLGGGRSIQLSYVGISNCQLILSASTKKVKSNFFLSDRINFSFPERQTASALRAKATCILLINIR